MNNKTFSQLAKEQKDPFKALFYFELSRLDASDYDKATALMTEERREIYDRCKIQLECEAELLKGAKDYIAMSDSVVKKLESSFAELLKRVNE